ncbi:M14 family zinc carboxypeptidase [Planctomycetaceae bacterium SH139]
MLVPWTLLTTIALLLPVADAEIPRSVAERSGYTRTASEEEIDSILAATVAADPRMKRFTLGRSHEQRPIQALMIGFDRPQPALTVVIIGGIHSGECAGKEALFDITREIAEGQHDDWLEQIRLLVIPSLSPDSNTRRAVDNRPGQLGPSEGMGQRANAQGLDLNRDFIKLESPEISALVAACQRFDADLLIDLHTTNGSQHRYQLTYDPPHHPLTPPSVSQFLRDQLLPAITEQAAGEGLNMFYYGNFDRSHTRWSTYGYEGRYSTNYMGLRGRLGLLSEAYSYASYQTRIAASRSLVVNTLDYLAERAVSTEQMLSEVRRLAAGDPLPLRASLAPFAEPATILGYKPDPPVAGTEREPFDYQVQFFGRYEPTVNGELPAVYFIPAGERSAIELIYKHGIQSSPHPPSALGQFQAFAIEQCEVAERAFQGHNMVTLKGTWQDAAPPTDTTGIWVTTDQPLSRLVAVILEPESADSLATWNIIPADRLPTGGTYPILKASQKVE